MENYSVLMSVYHKVDPKHFEASIQSMVEQSVRTNDFVIVCDGPLTDELDAVLEDFCNRYPGLFNIVRLLENVGIGRAANSGIRCCRNDLVAKMDADDLAVPTRCEHQLQLFERNPELVIAGGYIEEFDEDPDTPFSVRDVPLDCDAICKYSRRRQAFNNQTVMYRRSVVESVGGYRDLRRSEDFDLYLRLLHSGAAAQNLPEVLVKVRVNNAAMMRRASWETLKGCAQSRWYSFRLGYASLVDVIICVCGEFVIWISPARVQQFIYQHFLRKGVTNEQGTDISGAACD